MSTRWAARVDKKEIKQQPSTASQARRLAMPCSSSVSTVSSYGSVPDGRPSVDVEPGLVLGVERAQHFGEPAADLVVVVGEVVQAPVAQLQRVAYLKQLRIRG